MSESRIMSENSDMKSPQLENVSEFFKSVDPSRTSIKENNGVCLPQVVNIIKAFGTRSDKSNVHGAPNICKYKEILPSDDPALSDSVRKFFSGITSSSNTNNFRDDVPLMPLTELQSSEKIEEKPVQQIRNNASDGDSGHQPKKLKPYKNRFTGPRRYRHTYFDSDGNPIDLSPSNKENNELPLQQSQPVNINTSPTVCSLGAKADNSNLNFDDDVDRTMYKFNETLQLNDPVLSELKQPCEKVPIQNVFHPTTDFNDDVQVIKLKSSDDTTMEPLRVPQFMIAEKTIATFKDNTIKFHDAKDELVSADLLTNFRTSEEMVTSKKIASSMVNSKYNYYHPTIGACGQLNKHIHIENRFTKTRRYKHTYFDSDGNAVEVNPQASSVSLSEHEEE